VRRLRSSAVGDTSIRCRSIIDMSGPSRQERRQLLAAAASQLDDARQGTRSSEHAGGMRREQTRLRARDGIPRQAADRLEQRRPQDVVQISRRELPRRSRQIRPNIARKFARLVANRSAGRPAAARPPVGTCVKGQHVWRNEAWRRHRGSNRGTSCERSAGAVHEPCWARRLSWQSARRRKIGRVLRVRRHRLKARKRPERRARPLPSVPHEILGAPGASACGMAADRFGIPTRKIEHALRGPRLVVPPRMAAFDALRRPKCGALEFRFGGKAHATPPRIGRWPPRD